MVTKRDVLLWLANEIYKEEGVDITITFSDPLAEDRLRTGHMTESETRAYVEPPPVRDEC